MRRKKFVKEEDPFERLVDDLYLSLEPGMEKYKKERDEELAAQRKWEIENWVPDEQDERENLKH